MAEETKDTKHFAFIALIAALAFSTHAQDQIRVRVRNLSAVVITEWVIPSNRTSPTRLTLPIATRSVQIFAEPNSARIPPLILEGGPLTPVDISLGASFVFAQTDPTPVGGDFAGLDATAVVEAGFYGGISGDLVGDLMVPMLVRFDADGTIRNPIRSLRAHPQTGGIWVEAGSFDMLPGRVVSVQFGSIRRVATTWGDLRGGVLAEQGNIQDIVVARDLLRDVRAPQGAIQGAIAVSRFIDPDGTTRPLIQAQIGIERISAQRINADIDSYFGQTGNVGSLGLLGRLQTTAGPLTGSLRMLRLLSSSPDGGMFIAGDLLSDVTVVGGVLEPVVITGSIPAGRVFDIGGNVVAQPACGGGPATDASITVQGSMNGLIRVGRRLGSPEGFLGLPTAQSGFIQIGSANNPGLGGQIIINGLNGGATGTPACEPSGPWRWWSDMRLAGGNIVLSTAPAQLPHRLAPHYTTLSSTLGGGSIGEVPYGMHDTDCDPPSGSLTPPVGTGQNWITLRF